MKSHHSLEILQAMTQQLPQKDDRIIFQKSHQDPCISGDWVTEFADKPIISHTWYVGIMKEAHGRT